MMKLSAQFKDGFISLICDAETEAEQRMIGALINQPSETYEIDQTLLMAKIESEGHFTNRKVKSLRLTVMKKQP